jgi:hypothetical protein
MNLVIVMVIAVVLFGLAFLSKRHFGMHGLALAAGYTLSTLWGGDLAVILAGTGVLPVAIPASAVVSLGLTLLPALLLLIRGKKYKKMTGRLFGAGAFTLLALALIVQPLSSTVPLDTTGVVVYTLLLQYQSLIIGAGIIVAVIDILLAKPAKPVPEAKH